MAPHTNHEVRKAIKEAQKYPHIRIRENSGRTAKGWGAICCCGCGKDWPIFKTGKGAEVAASGIREFVRKHKGCKK